MARKDPQFNLRLPEELKQWVENEAQKNFRSQTAEVVFALMEEKNGESRQWPETKKPQRGESRQASQRVQLSGRKRHAE